MKKITSILSILLLCICIYCTPSLAATIKSPVYTGVEEESLLLPVSQRTSNSKFQPSTRGEAIAMSSLSISNAGGGVIGVVAHTFLHKKIEWGMITIYLDKWDAANEKWVFLEVYEYEFPDGNGASTALDVELNITDQEAGYYYSVRGFHEIEFTNEKNEKVWETHQTRTDGVFITKTP